MCVCSKIAYCFTERENNICVVKTISCVKNKRVFWPKQNSVLYNYVFGSINVLKYKGK